MEKHDLGKIFIAPIDVVFSMTSVVEPDIVFIAKERLNIIAKKNIVAAPDLIIEILSEATMTIDRTKKKTLYEEFGVKEYWLVFPDEKSVEQYILRKGKYVLKGTFTGKQKFTSEIIKGVVVGVGKVFEELRREN